MKRRGFLKFLGAAPAVAAVPSAAEKFAETAKALDVPLQKPLDYAQHRADMMAIAGITETLIGVGLWRAADDAFDKRLDHMDEAAWMAWRKKR